MGQRNRLCIRKKSDHFAPFTNLMLLAGFMEVVLLLEAMTLKT